ncbi:4'-phosphopantetheinyl transferase superfamily protein [Jiella sp. M17.18]|uniref:4'-phosphopantetheinyl transferase family protein n=1 Tax=Jiella sp. M17.18 TaxID=3234247 RepID=UPI0034DF3C4A
MNDDHLHRSGEITVWLTDLDAVDAAAATAYERMLDADERRRFERYKVEGARREYLVGRALVRTTLSRIADVAPADWRFAANRYGRPAIAPEQAHLAPGLVFNLSHTRGLVALAVGRSCDLGIDVEMIARESAIHDLAGRYFAPSEAAYAWAAEGAELTERFFAFWTLKEAYIKARGMGLALPLDGFAYDIRGEGPPTIAFTDACPDNPARWRFLRRRFGATHRLALAVSAPQAELSVRFVRTVPLAGAEEELERVTLPPSAGAAA